MIVKRLRIFLFAAFLVLLLSGCGSSSRILVVEFPSIIQDLRARASIPLYNKSSYFAEIWVRGRKVGELPPGASFQTAASVPFEGTELPIAALLYGPGDEYIGCYTDVLYLSRYQSQVDEFRITNGRIKYINERPPTTSGKYEYEKIGWVLKSLPVPHWKHTLMVQVVYNSNLPGVLRVNGREVKTFPGGSVHGHERIYFLEKILNDYYYKYGKLIFDVKYVRRNMVLGYSREQEVSFYVSKPEAYALVLGPDVYEE